MFIDLHTHSTASDGTQSPEVLIRAARDAGLSAIALTDHDTVAGCAQAAQTAREVGIDFLPGIEISCEFPRPGTLHLLGYGVDPHSPELHALTARLIAARTARNAQMLAAMRAAGIDISDAELATEAAGGTVGRPHIARILVRKGYAADNNDAFKRLLGQGSPFYVSKENTTSRQAIEMIHDAGGLAVLAHPVQLKRENNAQLEAVIKNLADQGLDGVEVIHSDHRDSFIDYLTDLTTRWNLLPTGGSDYHGQGKPHIHLGHAGNRRIPREIYTRLLDRLATRSRG
jgi:predicted metal-dependent phosphoesterase TrpH